MGIELTRDVEARRIQRNHDKIVSQTTQKWEYYEGDSLVEATRLARDMGWSIKKVQVRYVRNEDNTMTYYVEPYEKGCGCRGILKYKDFF